MPSPQYSKAKGRDAENAVVAYLQSRGWPHAERRRQAGSADRGDIAGLPGRVIEVKDEKATDLAGWITELETEMANDQAQQGAVVRKRRGFPWRKADPDTVVNVGEWYAIMPLRLLVELWQHDDHTPGPSL